MAPGCKIGGSLEKKSKKLSMPRVELGGFANLGYRQSHVLPKSKNVKDFKF